MIMSEKKQLKKKITILPHTPSEFKIPWNGKFDMNRALLYGGTMGGECYESEGFEKLSQEKPSKSDKRGNMTATNEHSTTHEHIQIGLEIANFSKFLMMTLNNERQMVTSEKSARYTQINPSIDPNISNEESYLYQKWLKIFEIKIATLYPGVFSEVECHKKAQENARYMITGFVATKMNHTLPLVQLNRIASWMLKYCNDASAKGNSASYFEKRLAQDYEDFIYQLDELGLLDDRLQSNRKDRNLSMFANRQIETYFGDVYSISYQGSIAQYAQAHRHRTIDYSMIIDPNNHKFYVPEILKNDELLRDEWLKDIATVGETYPQGKLVTFNEAAPLRYLFMKAQERRCSMAQLEIDIQTRETLRLAVEALEAKGHPDALKARALVLRPRCGNGYPCNSKNCKFPGEKDNNRRI